MKYVYDTPGTIGEFPPLLDFLGRELRKVQVAVASLLPQQLEQLDVAPAKVYNGLVAFADGTNWNPGGGQGVYVYYAGAWNKLTAAGGVSSGNFTPTVSFGGAAVGLTYTSQVGRFRNSGDEHRIYLYLKLSAVGSSAGNMLISGLNDTAFATFDQALSVGTLTGINAGIHATWADVRNSAWRAKILKSTKTIQLTYVPQGATAETPVTNAEVENTFELAISGSYL